MKCVGCVCVWLRAAWVDERIGFGLYQSCENRGNVGGVSVFGLRWCRWEVGRGLGPGSGGVVLCLCEILLHLMDIYFLTCICL